MSSTEIDITFLTLGGDESLRTAFVGLTADPNHSQSSASDLDRLVVGLSSFLPVIPAGQAQPADDRQALGLFSERETKILHPRFARSSRGMRAFSSPSAGPARK